MGRGWADIHMVKGVLSAKLSGFQGKSVTFVTSIPIPVPEAPMGRGWTDIYTYKA